MEKKRFFIIIVVRIIIALTVIGIIIMSIIKYKNRIIDVSGAKHSVTIIDNTDFYKKPKNENTKNPKNKHSTDACPV